MPNTQLAAAGYKRLVTEIASLYEGARKALVEAYWKIGQRIVQVEQKGEIKAAYGTGLLQKLSEDLSKQLGSGFSESNLRRMRQFYAAHPKQPPAVELEWSYYTELLPIGDKAVRERLIQKTLRENLDTKTIRRLVQAELVREAVEENLSGRGEKEPDPPELLTPVRGMLYAYRITSPDEFSKTRRIVAGAKATAIKPKFLIDLGFSSYKDLDDVTGRGLKLGDIVISAKDPKGNYSLKPQSQKATKPQGVENPSCGVCRVADPLYTYQAEVERIVDGDTLRVIVDLGFGFKTRQYLRLRGLDCPEMDTPEGKKAADFVRSRIRVASEIILTSSKSDKYDRYLADIYFMDSKGQENYLNNLLLQEGLAVVSA